MSTASLCIVIFLLLINLIHHRSNDRKSHKDGHNWSYLTGNLYKCFSYTYTTKSRRVEGLSLLNRGSSWIAIIFTIKKIRGPPLLFLCSSPSLQQTQGPRGGDRGEVSVLVGSIFAVFYNYWFPQRGHVIDRHEDITVGRRSIPCYSPWL